MKMPERAAQTLAAIVKLFGPISSDQLRLTAVVNFKYTQIGIASGSSVHNGMYVNVSQPKQTHVQATAAHPYGDGANETKKRKTEKQQPK